MSNRTITYDRFLGRVAPYTGVQKSDLNTDDKAALLSFFNRAIRYIWEYDRWPEVCTIETRTPSSNVIAWEQAGETAIESVFAIYDVDPHGTTAPVLQKYDLITSGAKLIDEDATTSAVYVWYRHQVPDFYGDDYSATATYAADDQVYYDTSGEYYICTAGTMGNAPTETAYWTKLSLPFRFIDYCVASAYADWLRQDGQASKAALQDRTAVEALDKELDRLEREEGYQTAPQVKTHLSNYDNI